jgi:hypothetical protein
VSRVRLFVAALAVIGFALPLVPGALADANHRFSATVLPSAVQPLADRAYAISILNRPNSTESAQSAVITVPAGFVVNALSLTAATVGADGCSAATWSSTLGATSISVSAPDAASELAAGCTLSVTFSAVSPAVEGSYTWTTTVSRGATHYDIQGPQPKVTVDGTAPAAPSITEKPLNPSNDSTPTFAFSDSDASATFQCQLDGGGFSACTSPTTYPTVANGPHTFDVKAIDLAGNESAPTSYSWTIDAGTPPTPAIDSHPPDPDNDTSPTFQFSDTEGGVTFQCKLDSGSFVGCSSPKTYTDITGNGSHTFSVRALDAVQNTSAAASFTWTIDTVPPVVTFDTTPSNLSKDSTPTFAFHANEASTFECKLETQAFSPCTSPKTFATTPDGPHTFTVRATDAAGNPNSASFAWTIDATAPVLSVTVKPADPSGVATAHFEFAATDASSVAFQCQLDGGSFQACATPPGKDYSSLSNATHTFTLMGTDAAGNVSTTAYSWLVDTENPVVTITSKPPNPSNQTSASFSFTSSKNPSTFQCKLDDQAFSSCTSPQTYGLPQLAEGTHSFSVKATDLLARTGPTTTFTWTIDLTPPPAPSIAGGPPSATNATGASFVFSDSEAGLSFGCQLDGGTYSPCTSPTTYSGLPNGTHSFAVRATDAAGNTGPAASYGWLIDTIAPDTTITAHPAAVSSSASATFEFTSNEPLTSFSCSLDGGAFASCSSPQTYGALANGSHTFQVRASDLVGNTDPTPASYSWQVSTLTPPDTTPPGTVRRLRRSVSYRLLKLTWALPKDSDFDHVRVLMSRGAKSIPRTVVYSGKRTTYSNTRFQNGAYYRYAVISYDHFGNASRRANVTVPASALLLSPRDGAVVKSPPRLMWTRVAKASFYNVQLYSPTAKLLSAWPGRAALTLQRSWTYGGRRVQLKKGLYRWFVWPGFGPRSKARYGQLLGQGSFRVS